MMDLDDVRVFTQVVQSGSFTKAAQVLELPKSTVSRRLSHLEDELKVRLLHRTTRSLKLTPAGEIYFSRTSRIVADLEDAERALLEMEDSPRGLLRITMPADLEGTMPKLLEAFQEEFPLVEIAVFATGRRVDLVGEGIDLALRAGEMSDSTLVSRKLLRSEFRIYASPQYIEEFGEPSCPGELLQHRCLIFGRGEPRDVWKLLGPEGEKEVSVAGRLSFNSFGFLRAAAEESMGIAYLPSLVEGSDPSCLSEQRLRRILREYRSKESGIYAVYPSPRHLSPKVRVFIDFAAQWLKTNARIL